MENLLLNGLPVPLPDMKDMDDCIIQEMNFKLSNEEIVNEWDTKIRRKIASKLSVCKNEKVFEDVLKDYLRLLKEQAKNFKEKKVLKDKISCHLKVFHLLCYSTREHIGLYMVNFLDYIEEILIVLCNLELEVIRKIKMNYEGKEFKKTVKRVARRIIDSLSVNLLHEGKRIFHVLLKLDYKHEKSWKAVMRIVYSHYLIQVPVRDRSDLSFCRYYLLFQKWKNITDKNSHSVMDKIINFQFNTSSESISSNPVLKSILLPSTESLVDLVDVLTNGPQVTVNAYFKYIEGRNEEDEICVPHAIELDSDEDEGSTQTLLFSPSESEKRRNGLIKSERQNKSPIQENTRYIEVSSSNGQVVCVIDDDSDIEEVCVQDNRSSRRRKLGYKSASSRPVLSFLDSICLPDDDSSPVHRLPSIEEEMEVPPTTPAESTILPIVTAYIDSVRRKGALADTDTQETSTMGMESLNIRLNVQQEVNCLTDVLNANSSSENVNDSERCIRTTNLDTGDTSNNKNNRSSVVQEVSVQSVVTSSDNVVLNEVQINNESEKCTCCSKHLTNTNNSNNSSSNNMQSETNKSNNKSVRKPDLKTVEIQTENMDSFNYLCGMITPPSDRTADENSPSSMENICAESEIHNVNSGHRNVYAYVPSTPEPYTENTSHNHYETHSSNYAGVCESSTQVYNFDMPRDTQNQNESILEENAIQSSREHIQEQNTKLKESLVNAILLPVQINQSNQEAVNQLTETPTEKPINEIGLSEEPLSEVQSNEFENVVEPEKQVNEDRFIETELEEHTSENSFNKTLIEEKQTNENGFNETQVEEQLNENAFDEEVEEEVNQIGLEETETEEHLNENEFSETCIEDSEEIIDELELNVTHIDDTQLVSEIELHEETLVDALSDIEVSENESSSENEGNLESYELEHCRDTSETNAQEGNLDHLITNIEEHQIIGSIEKNYALNEPQSAVNNIGNDSIYADLSNVPIILTESQTAVLNESAVDIIPIDVINTVILGDRFAPDKELVFIPTVDEDGGESTKFTVYKIATGISEEHFIDISESNQVNNHSRSISIEQNRVLNENEPSIVTDLNTAASEAQSCKIQASVTMTQLLNKTSSKTSKNGEHVKMARKKNIEENADKIIFTSNERVKSAPLSLFAKFEQSQSDLVENAFSGPIEPINGRTNINCDNSNSNDSFCLFDSDRSTIIKDFRDNNTTSNSPEVGDSPISPPYENIHAQDYQNYILNVNLNSLNMKEKTITQKTNLKHKEEKKLHSDTQNRFEVPIRTSIMSKKGTSKRKHSDNRPASKKLRVNFGGTEIRFIHREQDKIINGITTGETLQEYNVGFDDVKLYYLEPKVVVKLDTPEELKTRLHKVYVNSILNNLLFEKKVKAENTCIMARVDYKKPIEHNLLKNRHVESFSDRSNSHSAESSLPSAVTEQVDTSRISGISPPSNCIPALNSSRPGLKRASDYSQDKEDSGNYNSDSRVRTRRKRMPTLKAQKMSLPKTSPEPSSSSKSQKRPRGRPKKTETTRKRSRPNNYNKGVLYSDGPFRLG